MPKENYFEYPVRPNWELQEDYMTPYRFSEELKQYVKYMFEHPKHSKFRGLFTSLAIDRDYNDMLKPAYLIIRDFQDNPQHYGHSMDNVVPTMLVRMWKAFLSLHKNCRGAQFTRYYPASMRMLVLGRGKFLDIFLKDIDEGNFILHGDDMVKERKGVGLRERRVGYKESDLYYFDHIDD